MKDKINFRPKEVLKHKMKLKTTIGANTERKHFQQKAIKKGEGPALYKFSGRNNLQRERRKMN